MSRLTVEQAGPLALVQDLGRPGLAHLGVSPSGAADRAAHRLANRLVGNDEHAATIEVTLGGLVVRASALVWVVVTGVPTTLRVSGSAAGREPAGRAAASHAVLGLHPGDQLQILPPAHGLRNYLAVRGGLVVETTLGSRSTDVLSGLGPAPLRPGAVLPVGEPSDGFPGVDVVPAAGPDPRLDVTPGPRVDWFTDAAWATLLAEPWRVTPDSNRVAVRLAGPVLERRVPAELPSEGLLRGAVQVPAAGRPIVFGADHPVTGGYPVIAVITPAACDQTAQLRPGDDVRFRRLR